MNHELLDVYVQAATQQQYWINVWTSDRNTCHQLGLTHKVSAILVFTDESRQHIVLQQRATHMSSWGRRWTTAGHVKTGQTFFAWAIQELHEEIFFEIESPEHSSPIELFTIEKKKTMKNHDDIVTGYNHELIRVSYCISSWPFKRDPDEVATIKVIDMKTLMQDITKNPSAYSDTLQLILKEYHSFQQNEPIYYQKHIVLDNIYKNQTAEVFY